MSELNYKRGIDVLKIGESKNVGFSLKQQLTLLLYSDRNLA